MRGLSRLVGLLLWVALGLAATRALSQPVEAPAEQPARGRLELRVSEAGARVLVDGKLYGVTPLAPIELVEGDHVVVVVQDGFARFEKRVSIAEGETLSLDVRLEPKAHEGKVRVTVKGEAPMRVFVDGKDVGPAPYEGSLAPGEHEIAGRSGEARASAVPVTIAAGETATVELVPEGIATVEVRVDDGEATIAIDGRERGRGHLRLELSEGEHTIVVTREGYEPFEKTLDLRAGDTQVETVTLRKRAAGQIDSSVDDGTFHFDGVYGGLGLVGMFEPTGTNGTLEESCDAVGATSCEAGTPMGAGLAGYIGYAFAPVGLELYVLAAGDVHEPVASFDGTTGSEVNPLVASPAREEQFIIGRFGGGGALRLRLLHPIDRFRLTGALGAGAVYRHMLLGRDTVSDSGQTSSVSPEGAGYLSAVLSLELGGQVVLAGSTALALGFSLWIEHAGTDTTSEAESDTFLAGGDEPPRPQATPAYDMAVGTQLFLGPFLGLHFGP